MLTNQANACRRVFSGIQPTGVPHLGNYFGAISSWIRLTTNHIELTRDNIEPLSTSSEPQNAEQSRAIRCETPIFSIVDVHSYSTSRSSWRETLYENILSTTASLLALGLDPEKCILFRQSDILEHNYLANVLQNFVAPGRLKGMIQFKEKSRQSSSLVTNGLLNYPVLQAADILAYKADLVPVGADQMQHIELTRDIAEKFNSALECEFFPQPEAFFGSSIHSRRLRSLRDPEKKMSKSDPSPKSFIQVIDDPEVIVEKCKKALTDQISDVYYDPEARPGVSNLILIYHLCTGLSFSDIEAQFRGTDTAQFKLSLADSLIEKFKKTREEFKLLRADPDHLEKVLELGSSKARPIANETIMGVKRLLGSQKA